MNSWLGSLGSVQGRNFRVSFPVESLACLNVLYEKEPIVCVGGFDEELGNMCEDADMNYRLRKMEKKLIFLPDLEVVHHSRKSLQDWISNMYAYGVGRARIMLKHRTVFNWAYAAALAFLPGVLLLTLIGFLGILIGSPIKFCLLIWLYGPFVFFYGVFLAILTQPSLGLSVGIILLATQFSYAIGLWSGFCRFLKPFPNSSEKRAKG